jgi:uncharacterized protein (DUF2062 family)
MMAEEASIIPRESWWRRWFVKPVMKQLTAGMSPNRISWTISLGIVLGVFPILGSPTLICLFVGWMFGLNQPLLQVFKELVYPLHLALILVFIRLGERLYGVPLTLFSISQLMAKFKDDPAKFMSDFGMTALHGVSAWLLMAPFVAIIIKISVMPIVQRLSRSRIARKEINS